MSLMRTMWPSHRSCVAANIASTLSKPALLRTSILETPSSHFILMIRLRCCCCTASSRFICPLYSVYVSAEYSKAGRTTALYTLHLVESRIPGLFHSFFPSFAYAAHALWMRQLISLSARLSGVRVLPKYLKLLTTFRVSPFIFISGSLGAVLFG